MRPLQGEQRDPAALRLGFCEQPACRPMAACQVQPRRCQLYCDSRDLVRPPQPLVFVFLIDVSYGAIQSGRVATATRTIFESLERIPNADNQTKTTIIGFDTALYFFSLISGTTESSVMVVSNTEDVFLPQFVGWSTRPSAALGLRAYSGGSTRCLRRLRARGVQWTRLCRLAL